MKFLSYDQKGRIDSNKSFDEPWVRIILANDGTLLEARTYCPVSEIDIDCTHEFSASDTWMTRVIQDFCDRETAEETALFACNA